jgi:23S rRNA (cytosine1962-C5)-methyltransferase
VFSNEIEGSIASLPLGGLVEVTTANGKFLGHGYANPNSLIAVRILSRNRSADLSQVGFFTRRIEGALKLRQRLYPGRTAYRLISSEADGLPGLVVDRFNDVLSVQINTLGMEHLKELIKTALQTVLNPSGAIFRNEASVRELEGLPREKGLWFGEVPDFVDIDEFGVKFRVQLLEGQKTGHFFDQADNRLFAGKLCRDLSVLDVYSNSGGWGLHALKHGAKEVIFVDKQEACCEQIEANVALNGFEDRAVILCDEGKKTLEALITKGMRFDAVNLDPPAFAKQRRAANSALKGYREINRLGLNLVKPGGFFFTSSCSYHVHEEKFIEAVQKAAQDAGKALQMIRRGEQGSDHPTRPEVPETRYLKSYAFQVRPEW